MTEITFFTDFEELKLSLPPVPAREFWPEWFKKQKGNWEDRDGTKRMTVKSCPGILDALSYGYIIPLWSDYMVVRVSPTEENSNRHIGWRLPEGNDDKFFAGSHSGDQIDSYPFPPNTFKGTFKFVNPWSIRTPPGYSCYITAPHYNKHPNLTTLSGIVDTDIYHEAHINTWFTAPLNKEIILPYGMPLAQIIPFNREEFEMKTEVGDHRSMINKMTQFIHKSKFAKQHYREKLMINRYK